MTDVDINPFGGEASREHDMTEPRTEEPMGEHIALTPVGRSTWEPEREQETSFGRGESQRTKLMKVYVKDLYKKLSETLVKPQKHFTTIISNWKMENCTTEVR